jgi:WD40 repeat protein
MVIAIKLHGFLPRQCRPFRTLLSLAAARRFVLIGQFLFCAVCFGQPGKSLQWLNIQARSHSAFAVSNDHLLLAIGGRDTAVRLFSLPSGKLLNQLSFVSRRSAKESATISALAFSRDSALLASGRDDGLVHIWDPHKSRFLQELVGNSGPVEALQFSADGRYLISVTKGSSAPSLRAWDLSSGAQLRRLDLPERPSSIDISKNGKLLAVTASDKILVFSFPEMALVHEFIGGTKHTTVDVVRFTPTSEIIIGIDGGVGRVSGWSIASPQKVIDFFIPGWEIDNPLLGVGFCGVGQTLAVVRKDGSVHVLDAWDQPPRESVRISFPGERSHSFPNLLTPDCKTIVSAAADQVWVLPNAEQLILQRDKKKTSSPLPIQQPALDWARNWDARFTGNISLKNLANISEEIVSEVFLLKRGLRLSGQICYGFLNSTECYPISGDASPQGKVRLSEGRWGNEFVGQYIQSSQIIGISHRFVLNVSEKHEDDFFRLPEPKPYKDQQFLNFISALKGAISRKDRAAIMSLMVNNFQYGDDRFSRTEALRRIEVDGHLSSIAAILNSGATRPGFYWHEGRPTRLAQDAEPCGVDCPYKIVLVFQRYDNGQWKWVALNFPGD